MILILLQLSIIFGVLSLIHRIYSANVGKERKEMRWRKVHNTPVTKKQAYVRKLEELKTSNLVKAEMVYSESGMITLGTIIRKAFKLNIFSKRKINKVIRFTFSFDQLKN